MCFNSRTLKQFSIEVSTRLVIAGLDPAIHSIGLWVVTAWMPGSSPGMTNTWLITMAGALMPGALAPLPYSRAVDPGRGILLQGHDALILAPLQGLLGGTKLRGDAPLHIAIPASGEDQAGTRCDQDEELRHRLKSETRPKRARLDRRDEIGGKSARREA